MVINLVCGTKLQGVFKSSRYFSVNLGRTATLIDKSGRRVPNLDDKFLNYYSTLYRRNIYGFGNVGEMKFYLDHYINDNSFYCFIDGEYIEYEMDMELLKQNGIDFYLGYILKNIDIDINTKITNNQKAKEERAKQADAGKIASNPGNVTYADILAYKEAKRKGKI